MKIGNAIADIHIRELKMKYRVALKKEMEELKRNPYNKSQVKKYKDEIYKYLLKKGFSEEECVEIFNKA